jgi:hypothetical protein
MPVWILVRQNTHHKKKTLLTILCTRGVPPVCNACGLRGSPLERLRCFGSVAVVPEGFFPAYNDIDGEFVGLDECSWLWRSGKQFSPCNVTLVEFGRTSSSDLCAEGYTARLCSACKTGWYLQGRECVSCSDQSSFAFMIVGIVFCTAAMLVFLFLRQNNGLIYVWAEIAVFVTMLVLNGASSYMLSIVLVLVALQIVLQIQQAIVSHKERDRLISLSGFVKLFVFFVQSSQSINGELFIAWDEILNAISFIQLRVSGVRCYESELFDSPVASFLVFMSIPALLVGAICLLLTLRWIVVAVISCLQRSWRKRSKAKNDDAAPLLVSSSRSHSVNYTSSLFEGFASVALFVLYSL